MKLLMNAHVKPVVNHHKVNRYVENVCPDIRLRLAMPLHRIDVINHLCTFEVRDKE